MLFHKISRVYVGSQNRGLFKKDATTELKQFDLTQSEKVVVEKSKGVFVLDDFVSVVKKFVQGN